MQHEPVAGAFALAVAAAFLFGRDPDTGRRTPSAWEIGVLALAFVLAANAVRLVAVGSVVAAPIVIRRLAGIVPNTPVTWLASSLSPWLLAGWMLVRSGTSFGVGFEPYHFPVAAVDYIQAHELQGRMWNSSVYGGYLAWRLHPAHRVLMDGRTSWVHEPRLIALARRSERQPAAFAALVEEFDIQWAISRAVEGEVFGLPLAADRTWAMVFWDDVSAVYVSKDGPNRAVASSGYRLLRHRTPLPSILMLASRAQRVDDLAHDAALAVLHAPESPRAAFLSGCAALGRRDEKALFDAVERVRTLSPRPEPAILLERAWMSVAASQRQ